MKYLPTIASVLLGLLFLMASVTFFLHMVPDQKPPEGSPVALFMGAFGPTGYMRSMQMNLDADALTEFSPDKRWGLVRGKGLEHYEAKDGDLFDFVTRWTALMVRNDDGKWRLRAIHFGTNDLDNPVLTKVRRTLIRYGAIASMACLFIGLALGWIIGRRTRAT